MQIHAHIHTYPIQLERYERMDENIPDPFLNFVEQQKYEVPKSHESSIDVPRPW
jgi:hypothetical protein